MTTQGNPTLPTSPIVSSGSGPAAEAGIVQIDLNAPTGQIVTGAEFGLATTMGDYNHDYLPYQDPAFQAVADKYPTDLLRHNWELNTQMDSIFPSRADATNPNFSYIDNYLSQQGNLSGFFNNNTGTQIVTLGFPSWLDISSATDRALYASMVKEIAQHFIAMGQPIHDYELVNEPGPGGLSITDMAATFNVTAEALKSVDPTYKLGGLDEMWMSTSDTQQFLQLCAPNIGFLAWHQYTTNGTDGQNNQQIVTNGMTRIENDAATARSLMEAAGVSDSVPLFMGEYNVDGAIYDDPNNGNMIGAVSAAAVTYGMIHSNTNLTMGALWCVENGSAYSVFGSQGDYHIDPVGLVLADLTAYMPGKLVQTTMPSNTPGLVGYTTEFGQGFSVALIDTNLSQGYTVDLSKDGLPTTGVYRVEVSNANPQGIKQVITDLSHVYVPAGSVVIVTNEAPHGGTEYTGTGGGGGGGGGSTDYITPGSGSFTDAAANVYTIDSAGNADENGAAIAGGSGTGAMELYSGNVYGQDANSHQWYTWNQSQWASAAAPPPPSSGVASIGVLTQNQARVNVDATQVHNQTVYGASIDVSASGVAKVQLGSTHDTMRFLNMSSVNVTAGSTGSTVSADEGNNTFAAGKGALSVTGGSGADNYIFHAGDVVMRINDFSLAKGDKLTVDKSLAGSMTEAQASNGGMNIWFGNSSGHIHISDMTSLPTSDIHFV